MKVRHPLRMVSDAGWLACSLAICLIGAGGAPASAADSSMSGVEGTTVTYSGTAVVVAPDLTLSSGDDITGAIVSIGSGLNDGGTDALDVSGALPGGITADYDANNGVMTLSGTSTPANYQAALRMVTFATTATVPGTSRQITFSIGSALPNPDNGHYYLFVASSGIDWTEAYAAASASTFMGRTGYLATVTSQEENDFVFSKDGRKGWIGASDDATYTGGTGEGDWRWATGPESGTPFWSGDESGSAVSGSYENWGSSEPNDWGSGEDYAHFLTSGMWNDYANTTNVDGYYVEYGGLLGDNPTVISGTATVELSEAPEATLIAIRNVHKKKQSDQLCSIPDLETGTLQIIGNLGGAHTWAKALAVLPGEGGDDDRIFAAERGKLLELDPATGAATVIGPVGWPDVTGLAFHPASRVLYGITYGTNKLLQIDTETGGGTVVASRVLNSSRLNDLAFHPGGDLYVITNDKPARLFEINAATGKKIARWILTGASGMESLLWSEDGETLYSAAMRNGYKDLCTIDLGTSTLDFVSETSSSMRDIEGLGWFRGELGTSKPSLADEEPEDVEDPDEVAAGWAAGDADETEGLPARLRLHENVPNPFNPTTRIEWELAEESDVQLVVYDVAGRLVATLAHGRMAAGRHAVTWYGLDAQGGRVASGIYLYTLRAGTETRTRRMVLVQ